MTDEKLKAAVKATPECPSLERLAAYLDSGGEDDTRAQMRAHIDGCPRCQTELALMREFVTAVPSAEEELPVKYIENRLKPEKRKAPAPRPAFARWAMAMAACLAMVVVGSLYLRQGAPELEGGGAAGTMRSIAIGGLTPAGDLAAAPAELQWEAAPGAASYTVRLMEVDRQVIWQTTVPVNHAAVPADVAARMTPMKTVKWEVVAQGPGGAELGRSQLTEMRLRP